MSDEKNNEKIEVKTAILVDGGFYRKRANYKVGEKTPKERADELERYCLDHLHDKYEKRYLYRIFYYDCPPIKNGCNIYHPLKQKSVNLGNSEQGKWMEEFLKELMHRRKFALRLGKLGAIGNTGICFNLKPEVTKALLAKSKLIDDLTEEDFSINWVQKEVDMRIGLDISSMAFKKQVNQIILIAGDSDFVPAAKLARREGIDFILDHMGNPITADLYEHIDGIRTKRFK